MAAVRHFPSPSPSPSPLPPLWLSLVCRLVVMSTPPPLVLLTLPPLQPLPINALPPLVCCCISSHLPLFAGCLSRRLLSCCLRPRLRFPAGILRNPVIPFFKLLERNCDSAPTGKLPGAPPGNQSVWSSVEIDAGFKNKYASHFCPNISQKNIVASLVHDAGAHLLGDGSWYRDRRRQQWRGGGRIRPPSSRRRTRHPADLLARDASYFNLRTYRWR